MKAKRPLIIFFTANLISFLGDRLTQFALPWFVLQTTGSVLQTGITAFFTTVPTTFSSVLSGPLVDRLGYKRTSICGDLASGSAMALIPLLFSTIGLPFWLFLALVFLGGLLKAPGATARSSLLPDLGQASGWRMERVNALSDGLLRSAGLIGTPLAAFLVVLTRASNLLWIDACSFLISAILIGLLISSPRTRNAPPEDTKLWSNELLEGARFIWSNRTLRAMILTSMGTNMLEGALLSVVLPVYAKEIWGSALPLGGLSVALGASALGSSLLFGMLGHHLPRRLTYALCFILIGGRFWALALGAPLPVLLGVYTISGLAVGPINPLGLTVQQEIIPQELRAKVFGTAFAGYNAGIPLGGLAGGSLILWMGLVPTLFLLGTCHLLATGSLLVNPALKEMH